MGKMRTPEEQMIYDQILEYLFTMNEEQLTETRDAIESILAASGEED